MSSTDFDPNNYVPEEENLTNEELTNDGPINPFAAITALMGDDFDLDKVPDNPSLVPDGQYTAVISEITSGMDPFGSGFEIVTISFEITSEDYEGMPVRSKYKVPNGTERTALVRQNMLSKIKQMYVSFGIDFKDASNVDLRDFENRSVELEITVQKFDDNKTGESRPYNRIEWFKLK